MSVSASGSPTTTAVRPRASLAVAMLGFFVVALDAQIVNVALPEIRTTWAAACPVCSGLSLATP
jgi:DHA2 family methylenomycin A resistance protein-like MFS transporter